MAEPNGETIPHFLIVDDDDTDVLLLERAFASAGVISQFRRAINGQIATHLLMENLRQQRLPCAVILDIKMPLMNGFETLAWIRRQPTLTHLPVIMMSSSGIPNDVQKAKSLGAHAYLVKPGRFKDLVSLAKQINERWGNGAAAIQPRDEDFPNSIG